jgi:hypothetical protein
MEGASSGLTRAARGGLAAVLLSLGLVANAAADTRKPPPTAARSTVTLGHYSQQDDRSRASIGVSIRVGVAEPGRDARSASRLISRVEQEPKRGGAADDLRDPYPPLRADSNLAQNPQPFGPDSFWYQPGGSGRVCIYAPNSVLPCYTLVGAGAPGGPGLDPGAIAASIADRLPLLPGHITTSPRRAGLTGTDSWFWLDPAPRIEELTVRLAGETVTVRADPAAVEWRFGDGIRLVGGSGQLYRAGPPPADAVLHLYETRCLPGDQGRNPYVLGSCGSGGYEVEAVIAWRITYSASGPVDASGALPSRTTATSIAYPVSEARGFLVPGAPR